MAQFLVFENSGKIDTRCITLFGCSVKESGNPIGFFGTGMKFAIAVLLRLGKEVTIQAGGDVLHVEQKVETIRGREFSCIYIAGTRAGFTTELGKAWEMWMAYRELYCNAKDEPDSRIYTANEIPLADTNKTRFIVKGEDFAAIHQRRDDFIIESAPDFTLGDIAVHARPSSALFYKGIKVGDFHFPALYTYNFLGDVDLTEDRTAKDVSTLQYRVARNWLRSVNKTGLARVLTAGEGVMEHYLDFHGWGMTPSAEFIDVTGSVQANELARVNATALRVWREVTGNLPCPATREPTMLQHKIIIKASEAARRIGFNVEQYPILIVGTFGEPGVLALADKVGKRILLSEELLLTGGVKMVARALIEEYLHLHHGYKDCSRELQNYLFGKMIALAEELTGEPL